MPSVKERQGALLFGVFSGPFLLKAENNFHWILFLAFRASFLISFILGCGLAAWLMTHEVLTKELVTFWIRSYVACASIPVLFIVLPLNFYKAVQIVGYSSIDFTNAFERPRYSPPEFPESEIVVRARVMFVMACGGMIGAGWFLIEQILSYYDVWSSVLAIALAMTIWCVMCGMGSIFAILSLMIHEQYRRRINQRN